MPKAHTSLAAVAFSFLNSSGAIHRIVPPDAVVVVNPCSSNTLERPKSVKHGVPSWDTSTFPYYKVIPNWPDHDYNDTPTPLISP